MAKLQKYILMQGGKQCWNVAHIAGYSVQGISGDATGIRAHPHIAPPGRPGNEGVYVYTAQNSKEAFQVFDELLRFLGNDQMLFNLSKR